MSRQILFSKQKLLASCLSAGLLIQPLFAFAAEPDVISGDVQVTVMPTVLDKALPLPGSGKTVNMALRDVAIPDALRGLAKKGGFNVALDDTVKGSLSVDLYNVTIQSALETIKSAGKLAYFVEGKTLMVSASDSERGKGFQRTRSKIIPLHHANAKVVANILNKSVFATPETSDTTDVSGQQTSGAQKVVPDFRTNSLIVVGTPSDIKTVEEHVAVLDTPRETRTWRLSQSNALNVATILASSVFNDGSPILSVTASGGSSSSGSSGNSSGSSGSGGTSSATAVNVGGLQSSGLRVRAENIAEGQGSNSTGSGSGSSGSSSDSSSSGSSGSGGAAGLNTNITLRAMIKEDQVVQVSPQGPIIIPDTRLNTITLLGTAEQIDLAESIIPTLDRKVPQVVLEASLVEIRDTGIKEFGYNAAGTNQGFAFGSNNAQGSTPNFNTAYSGRVGAATSATQPLESIFRFTTRPIQRATDVAYQLNALVNQNKAKILSNPTVLTSHDSEAVISIVDEIIKSVTVTIATLSTGGGSSTPTSTTANIGEAGIVLSILPKIGADGTITMRIKPTVSSIRNVTADRFGNTITLLSKREIVAQDVVVRDGESYVLGGLVQNSDSDVRSKIPLLGDLPIAGALARTSVRNKNKSELVVVITPHVVTDDAFSTRNYQGEQDLPAVLSSTQSSSPGFRDVAQTSASQKRQSLPALEPVHILNTLSAKKDKILGGAAPIFPIVPADPPVEKAPLTQKPEPIISAMKLSPPKDVTDISNQAIEDIIHKFKSEP